MRTGLIRSLVAVVTIAFARTRFLRRFEIAEASMEPALRPGDYVVVSRVPRRPRRRAAIVFEHPRRPGFYLVKRVIGLPGDRIDLDGATGVDGRRTGAGANRWSGRLVPPGHVFVLGDNVAASGADSRELGPIPVDRVEGTVVLRYWPPVRHR